MCVRILETRTKRENPLFRLLIRIQLKASWR